MDTNEDDARGRAVFIVTLTTFILATVFVVSRLFSRFAVFKTKTADDWVMILAWVCVMKVGYGTDLTDSSSLLLDYRSLFYTAPPRDLVNMMLIYQRSGSLLYAEANMLSLFSM